MTAYHFRFFEDIVGCVEDKEDPNVCKIQSDDYWIKVALVVQTESENNDDDEDDEDPTLNDNKTREMVLRVGAMNTQTYAKYGAHTITRKEIEGLSQPVEVLFKIFKLREHADANARLHLFLSDHGVKVCIKYVQSILTTESSFILKPLKESKEDLILFQMKQMQQRHKQEIDDLSAQFRNQIDTLLALHQTVILLPGTSKVLAVDAVKLTLDGRNVAQILQLALDSTKKTEENEEKKEEKKPKKKGKNGKNINVAMNYSYYQNNTQVTQQILAACKSFDITPVDINGCNSCGSLCTCNVNNHFTRNKLIMVMMDCMTKLRAEFISDQKDLDMPDQKCTEDIVDSLLVKHYSQFNHVCEELSQVLQFCLQPEFISFNGANILALQRLEQIRELTIANNDHVVDIKPLKGLVTLELLQIENCPKVILVNCLGKLIRLKTLSFRDCKRVSDITKLGHLKNLELLDVRGTAVINITMFHCYPQLRIEYDFAESKDSSNNAKKKWIPYLAAHSKK